MKKNILLFSTLVLVFMLVIGVESVSAESESLVFESFQNADSLTSWTCEEGITTSFDSAENAVKFSANITSPKKISYTGADILFSKNAKYRVSYKIKSPGNGSYFLGVELNGTGGKASWQLSPNGAASSTLYDNNYRGGGANGSTEWVNISYDFTVYDIKNDAGVSINEITIPAHKLFFQFNTATEYDIKDFKIEKIPFAQEGSVLINTVFEDDFNEESLPNWTASGGSLSEENGAIRFVGSGGRIAYTGKNITFGSDAIYRISYRTKITYDKAYFMALETGGPKWQYALDGGYAVNIYDNTADFRDTSRNLLNGAVTDNWTDVSYTVHMYDMQDASGSSVDSIKIPANKLFFNLPHNDTTFYIDSLKIEEIIENVGVSYDSAMGDVFIDGVLMANGTRVTAAKAAVSAEPKAGYLLQKFVVTDQNGVSTEYPATASDSVDLVFDCDSVVTAVFEAAPAPSVITGRVMADTYQNENSILVYSKVSAQGNPVSEFGIELKKAEDDANILPLKGMTGLSEENNKFGIRAFGAGLSAGSYQTRAYAVINGEVITEEWNSVTVSEKEGNE